MNRIKKVLENKRIKQAWWAEKPGQKLQYGKRLCSISTTTLGNHDGGSGDFGH